MKPSPLPHSLLLSLRRRGFNPPQPGLVEAPLWQLPDAVVVARSSAWWTRKTFSRAALQKHTPRTFKGPKLLSSKPDKNFDGCFKIDPNVNILQKKLSVCVAGILAQKSQNSHIIINCIIFWDFATLIQSYPVALTVSENFTFIVKSGLNCGHFLQPESWRQAQLVNPFRRQGVVLFQRKRQVFIVRLLWVVLTRHSSDWVG